MKRCDKCGYCVLVDYGYSNYTVEGTYVYCAISAHEKDPFDRWYGRDDKLKFAEKCPSFTHTHDPVHIDVDLNDKCAGDGPSRYAFYATELVSSEKLAEILD